MSSTDQPSHDISDQGIHKIENELNNDRESEKDGSDSVNIDRISGHSVSPRSSNGGSIDDKSAANANVGLGGMSASETSNSEYGSVGSPGSHQNSNRNSITTLATPPKATGTASNSSLAKLPGKGTSPTSEGNDQSHIQQQLSLQTSSAGNFTTAYFNM